MAINAWSLVAILIVKLIEKKKGDKMAKEKSFEDFVEAMKQRITEKQGEYGDSWKDMSLVDLMRRVTDNYVEWEKSSRYTDLYDREKVETEKRKLVDLANFAQFLWRRLEARK